MSFTTVPWSLYWQKLPFYRLCYRHHSKKEHILCDVNNSKSKLTGLTPGLICTDVLSCNSSQNYEYDFSNFRKKFPNYLSFTPAASYTLIKNCSWRLGTCQSSVVWSAPTNLQPRVWIPCTPSNCNWYWNEKWTKMNKKRPDLAYLIPICIVQIVIDIGMRNGRKWTKRGQIWPILFQFVLCKL